MPLSQNPVVDWPPELHHLLDGAQIIPGSNGKDCCRIDVDVDAETMFLLNAFEVRMRHRRVRLKFAGQTNCLVGEMNMLIGLGAASDPTRHVGRVRLSFHDLQDDSGLHGAPLA